jgi:hypothetical protein
MDEVKSDKGNPEESVVPVGKSLKKRYSLVALWFAIAGAAPLLLSLFQMAASAGVSKDSLGYAIGTLAFSAWLFISLPFSFLIGIVAISFAGYDLGLTEQDQSKTTARIAMVIGCLDVLIPIAIFIFFLMPIFPGVKGG